MKREKKKDIVLWKRRYYYKKRKRREETYRSRRTLSLSLEMMMMSVSRMLSILGLVAGRYTEFFFRRLKACKHG